MNRESNINQEVCVPRFLLGLVFVLTSVWCAQASDLSDQIQKRYDSLQSFRSFFLQKLTNASSREVQERLGSITFKRPRFIRWETTSPENELLIIGQNTVWEYFPEEETVYRYSVEQVLSSKTMIRFLSGEANLKDDFIVEDLGMDGEFRHLKIVPMEPEPNLVEGELWVRPGQDMLEKIKLVDFFGNINELELTGIEIDVTVEDKDFILNPPQGTDVIEGMVGE